MNAKAPKGNCRSQRPDQKRPPALWSMETSTLSACGWARYPALDVMWDLTAPTDTTELDRYPYVKRFMTCARLKTAFTFCFAFSGRTSLRVFLTFSFHLSLPTQSVTKSYSSPWSSAPSFGTGTHSHSTCSSPGGAPICWLPQKCSQTGAPLPLAATGSATML